MTTSPFTATAPFYFLREPPSAASDAEIFACLRLDLLQQDDADRILRGQIDVPTAPPRRLKLAIWERAQGMFLHAEQVYCAGLDRVRPVDLPSAKWVMNRARCRAQVARLRHELRRLPGSWRLEPMAGTRNLAAVMEGERYDGSEAVLFTFHVDIPAAQLRKLLIVYLRGRAQGRDE